MAEMRLNPPAPIFDILSAAEQFQAERPATVVTIPGAQPQAIKPLSGQRAVLVCNGPSAEGYAPPAGAYLVTVNGGCARPGAAAAFSTDGMMMGAEAKAAWRNFKGLHVLAEHNASLPDKPFETFDCLDMLHKTAGAGPCALAWLASKAFDSALVVGMDALNGGAPSNFSREGHQAAVRELAPRFPAGLYIWDGSAEVPAGEYLARVCAAPAPLAVRTPATAAPRKAEEKERPCLIPQSFVEIDPSPKCTRACSFCAPGIPAGRRQQKKALTLKAHNAFIDELRAVGYNRADRWLCYCGHGEPTLNKSLWEMIRYARAMLPRVTVSVYTNGDTFTEEMGCTLAALDVDYLFWDVYDETSAKQFPAILARSTYDPARVRVVNHVDGPQYYTSRCSSVKPGEVSKWIDKPCGMTGEKMLVTDDGKGGVGYLLCCDNLSRESLKTGISLADYCKGLEPVTAALKAGKRREAHGICAKCDRDGNCGGPLPSYPPLTETRFWPPAVTPPLTDGRRLVVLPACAKFAAEASVVLGAIRKASNMAGETLLIWNETGQKCPDHLRALADMVWEYPTLGWCGIVTAIGRALLHAYKGGFDWVLKLDTDTAILRKGWDSYICADCPKDAQAGTYMDETLTGGLTAKRLNEQGLFNPQLVQTARWARQYVGRGLRGWGHIQGGCYVIGREALARIERVIGLEAGDQAGLPEGQNIGEDVYLDTKCKVAGVRQVSTLHARSWYRDPKIGPMLVKHVIRQRDSEGVCAVHPVKELADLKALAEGIR